ncbi:MAG: Tm-1-like ATP-binding domain-containing protein [Planctomycetota bacterium]
MQSTKGRAVMMLPTDGTGSYAMPGGPLRDEDSDAIFFDALERGAPSGVEVVRVATHAEDSEFVRQCVERLVGLIEGR